jgi:hypothetical protein
MSKFRTRLTLTGLDDRLVPSAVVPEFKGRCPG